MLSKWILRALRLGFGLWALGLVALVLTDLIWSRDSPPLPEPAAAILCLGGGMSLTGWERPGPASTRRARSCAELYRAGVAPVVLFTGYGHHRSSAAAAMARVAMADGLPETAVILEEEARSTLQNAAFSLPLLPEGTERVVIVTDGFHLPRSWLIFRVLGAPEMALYPARSIYTSDDRPGTRNRVEWLLRESLAIWANLARLGLFLGAGALGVEAETRISWFN